MGSLWRCIFKGKDSFMKFVSFKVKNRENVHCWLNPWCNDKGLSQSLLLGYKKKKSLVKKFLIRSRSFYFWNLHFKRNLNDQEVKVVGILMHLLDSSELGNSEDPDNIWWTQSLDGEFSIHSFFHFMGGVRMACFLSLHLEPLNPFKDLFFHVVSSPNSIPTITPHVSLKG